MFGSSSLRLRLSGLLFGSVLLFGVPSLSWSQAFEDSAKYTVTGAELNKLQSDLLTAQKQLQDSQAENAQLKSDSIIKQKALEGLQTQLQTVSASFQKSQNEALGTEIKVGLLSFAGGAVAIELLHLTGVLK